jgi:PKD repeat protein
MMRSSMGRLALATVCLSIFSCDCSGVTNTAPDVRIDSPRDGEVLRGAGPFLLVGVVSDAEESLAPAQIAWASDRQGALGNGAVLSAVLAPGLHRLRLTATDTQGAIGRAELSVTVEGGQPPVNTEPVVAIDAPANGALFDEGQPIVLKGHATDAQDGMLSGAALSWTSSLSGALGTGAELTFSNAMLGRHRIVLTATDSQGLSAVASVELEVVRPGTNRPPVVTIGSPMNGASLVVGTATTLTGSATDAEDGALTGAALKWTSSRDGMLGTGASVTATLTQGVHVLTLTATDSQSATGTASVTVSVNAANNQPPVVTITAPANNLTFFQGASITFTGTGSDPEDGALTGAALAWSSDRDGPLGTGASLINTTLTAGTHLITLVGTDSGGNTGTATRTVQVLPMNAAPTVSITAPANNTSVAAGTSVVFTATATDPEDGALTGMAVRWNSSLSGSLGTGLSVSSASLLEGVHTITVTATDSGGRSASASVTLTVTPGASNLPPIARLTGPATGQATQGLIFDGSTSSDPDGTIAGWRFEFSDGSPAVTSMNTVTHVFAAPGTYTVTLTVTDDRGATGSTTLSVVISPFVRVPVVVDPTAADELASSACGLVARGTTLHVAWYTARHPTLWYATWASGVLTREVIDSLGFNVGGAVGPAVQLALDGAGVPHVAYVKDEQVWFAKKSGASWVKERADSVALPAYNPSSRPPSLALDASGKVWVAYETYSSSWEKVVVASRSAAGAWTQTQLPMTPVGTLYASRLRGDVTTDAAGVLYLVMEAYSSTSGGSFVPYLVSWNGTVNEVKSLGSPLPGLSQASSFAWAGASRLFVLGGTGLYDFGLSSPLSASTAAVSYVETSSTSQHAVAATASGEPRLVINHGSTLESVWPQATPGFWNRVDLGATDPGRIDAAVDANGDTRACFFRAGKLVVY